MLGQDLSLKGVSRAAAGLPTLASLDLEVAAGEHVALIERGDGAALTLLGLVAGFARPDIGRVVVGGVDVTDRPPGERPGVLVAADPGLFAAVRVEEAVALAAGRHLPHDRGARRARARALLEDHGLADVADRFPAALDAATLCRVALIRALAAEPALLLLDRTFLGVPVAERPRLRDLLDRIRRDTGVSVLERCDDPAEALARADRVGAVHDGRLVQIDTPDRIWSAPLSLAVARLGGAVDVVPGRLIDARGGKGRIDTPIGQLVGTLFGEIAPGTAVTAAIRPERIDLADREPAPDRVVNRFEADFVERRLTGPLVRHVFAVGDTRLTLVRIDRGLHRLLLAGRTLLAVDADDVWIHPAESEGDIGG